MFFVIKMTMIKFGLVFSLLASIRAAPLTGKQEPETELATEAQDSSLSTVSILEDLIAVNPSTSTAISLLNPVPESQASIISHNQEMDENGNFSYR